MGSTHMHARTHTYTLSLGLKGVKVKCDSIFWPAKGVEVNYFYIKVFFIVSSHQARFSESISDSKLFD